MIISSISEFKNKKLRVCFDEGADLCLYKSEVRRLHLSVGDELSQERYSVIVEEILIPRAKSRAMHLLEKQDRTEADLRNKLKESGYDSNVAETAIEYVKSFGYIDDLRYASNYVHFHQGKKSRRALITALLAKGIDADIINQALDDEYDIDESEQIRAILVKRHYDFDNATYEERAKQIRYLMSKGYNMDSVRRVLGTYYS